MSATFLDTSGWFAALSQKEARHAEARSAYRDSLKAGDALVTTNLVIAEMHVLVGRFRGPPAALSFLDSVHQDPAHEVVFVDRTTERAAIDRWLRKYNDQSISLTDAVSFEVMRRRRIERALALDHHFTMAGFDTVP